ncbi:hypothetical protein [Halalkalibacter okhensis]|uniref:hypothetical protein n=1 Tax=Halalkalibacter okhensis TaxID=333138 RepID=UPI000A96C66E|nr:hypothetical protein [Halalkalibacter okhensis]
MQKFEELPKTVKKTIRYILQDADMEKVDDIENVISYYIKKRKEILTGARD